MSYTVQYFGTIYIPLILSLAVHEYAHAFAAYKLGDDTAKHLGRMSLNPFVHLDIIGTFILPLCGVPFGWAKPVPFNPQRFRTDVSMNLGAALVAIAGPISNFILFLISILLLKLLGTVDSALLISLKLFLEKMLSINLVLGLFNLIPIPPLDGGHIVNYFMPKALRPVWEPIYTCGPFLLLIFFVIFSWYVNLVFNYFF